VTPQAHLERVEELVEKAVRWCPDATPQARREAVLHFAFESAHAKGLAHRWSLEPPRARPSPLARQLMEAAEEILAHSRPWDWPEGKEPLHPSGFGNGPDKICDECAWFEAGRCIQRSAADEAFLSWSGDHRACIRWESRREVEDCLSCGACCREGYSFAPVESDEALAHAHPELVRVCPDGSCRLDRPEGLCVALDRSAPGGYPCKVYPLRPRACAELSAGSLACLVARRRVGLSR